jgi:uncharacterized protein YdeI (YjbR/CyaY-like superfamily)
MSMSERASPEDLVEAFAVANVLKKFRRLPESDQQNFLRWVSLARDEESRWRRINALALALRMGPLSL